MEFSKALEIKERIKMGGPVLSLVIAENCKYCESLKQDLEEIKSLAESKGISLFNILATDPQNSEFLTENIFESVPYVLVFANGEFKGGENASKEMLEQLIPLLESAVKRDTLENPKYEHVAN